MRRRVASIWVLTVLTAALAWAAPAGAVQVSGKLVVTDATATTVSFLFTGKRTCTGGEQCDYFSELIQLADASACPAARPDDPWWILWTGNVQNTGPSSETGQATPRGWLAPTPPAPARLCQYIFADETYTLVDSALIAPGAAGGTTPGGGGPGSGPGGAGGPGGAAKPPGPPVPVAATCRRYGYQQNAQKALEADPTLARHLDQNGNGVACESLPKRKHYVGTVALSTAASATRAVLRKTYGSAFTDGARYRARCARVTRTRVRCSVSWRHHGTWRGSVSVVGRLRHNQRVIVARPHVLRPV